MSRCATMPPTWRRLGRETLVALTAYALLIAPFGCQLQTTLPTAGSDTPADTKRAGLFVNPDESDPLLLAGRNEAGDAFFLFGTRGPGGSIVGTNVESILLRTADGQESKIFFEQGLPTYLEGPDGSYLAIRYTETSTDRLTAHVTLVSGETGESQTFQAEVDLAAIRANLQAGVNAAAAALGSALDLTITPPDLNALAGAKMAQRSLSPVLALLVVAPLGALMIYTIYIMDKIVRASLEQAVLAALQGSLRIAVSPLALFSTLFSETGYRVTITPLFDVFLSLPGRPAARIGL